MRTKEKVGAHFALFECKNFYVLAVGTWKFPEACSLVSGAFS
jgi:hypothetical protein